MQEHETSFLKAKEICQKIQNAGFEAYIVGGCVRDKLMNIEPKDYDIATNATPTEIRSLFDRTLDVGVAFGIIVVIFKNEQFEIATFRTDSEYTDGRRPTSVKFSSIEEDVLRRDFTINAMFINPTTDKIIDLVGGVDDLKNKIVKCVGDPKLRLTEDRLRVLRAIRFATLDGFKIDDMTSSVISEISESINVISSERISSELAKMWLIDPKKAWSLLSSHGLVKTLFPASRDANTHFTNFAECVKSLTLSKDERLAICWAIAGGVTNPYVIELLKVRFKLPNDLIKKVTAIITNMKYLSDKDIFKKAQGIKFLMSDDSNMFVFMHSLLNDNMISSDIVVYHNDPIKKDFLPTGQDLINLGLKPNKNFGLILEEATNLILERKCKTKEDALKIVCNT